MAMYFSKQKFLEDCKGFISRYDYEHVHRLWVDKIDGEKVQSDGAGRYKCYGYGIEPEWCEERPDDCLKISEDGRDVHLPFSLKGVAVGNGEENLMEGLHLCVAYYANGVCYNVPLNIWCDMIQRGELQVFEDVDEAETVLENMILKN